MQDTSRSQNAQSFARNPKLESLEPKQLLSTVPPTVTDVAVSSTTWEEPFLDYLETSGLGSEGYSIPVGSAAQSNPLPWVDLDRITITFSEDVDVDANDLSITGVSNSTYAVDHFFYDPQEKQAMWILENPFAEEERVHLDLDGDGIDPVQDLSGNALDGDWYDELSTYNSGNGTAGGDFEFRFNLLKGDFDSSGSVDQWDYYTLHALGKSTTDLGYEAMYDSDGSGVLEASDWDAVIDNAEESLPAGTPAGVGNDAPSASHIPLVDIDDHTIDVAISLFDAFEDTEDNDSQLSFQVIGNSNPSLFDTLSIDGSTGEITISTASSAVSGRAQVVVQATDTLGLSTATTIPIDVNRDNLPPSIYNYFAEEDEEDTWILSGYVSDPDDPIESLMVEFWGVFEARASVDQTGYFEFTVILDSHSAGYELGQVVDSGLLSDTASVWLNLT